jgi:DNA-binding response OmpR family regulator
MNEEREYHSIMNGRARVLHVDDDPEFVTLSERVFDEDDRFELRTAVDGQEALDLIDEEAVDCLVSDSLRLPDGESFVAAARREHSALPIVLFTGKDWTEVADEARDIDAAGFVRKAQPGHFDTLRTRLARLAASPTDDGTEPFVRGATSESVGDDDWRVLARHEWGEDELCVTLLRAAERVLDGKRSERLYDAVDADSLESLLDHGDAETRVTFRFNGREFAVDGTGRIAVRRDD